MKQVMETYGSTVIAIMVMGAILILIGSYMYGDATATGNVIGYLANKSIEKNADYESTGFAFFQYSKQTPPEISYIEEYEIRAGEYVPVGNCFEAKSHEGEGVSVEVMCIIDMQEKQLQVYDYNQTMCFYFELPGIYQVYVKATDKENKTVYATVKLPVNRGTQQ